ncbi:MAG: electron transport complex subunit RsxC [Oscillospiraceae bacterium]|nr:electron transport complex subunit RsxC [Oscillospiraceae bacterium]
MQDYTKFKLKSNNELSLLLEGKDNLLVLSCNKCFKPFDGSCANEPELDDFLAIARDLGVNVTAAQRVDFLCNSHRLSKLLSNLPYQASAIVVISCGIGVQSVAELAKIPVYTACDSIKDSGNHGISLTDKQCDACGQCFLSTTNGICPVTQCSKGLLTGQCGGSKNGKCETDAEKDCAWEQIISQKSLDHNANSNDIMPAIMNDFTQLDDICVYNYNKISKHDTADLALQIQKKRDESFYGGLYLKHRKVFSAFLTLQKFPLPEKVVLPMSQHAGMSAEPIVRVGDYVMVGQKIGEAVGTLSSSVHASVSGVVSEIASYRHLTAQHETVCVTIISDGKDKLHKSVIPIPYWEDLDIYDIDAIIAEKGIVGMGGAGFPTPIKLKAQKPIDTILLNGCESEPYITADHRIMLEYADDIINGLKIILKCTGAKQGIIVISDNKSDAIRHLEAKTDEIDDIFVMALWSKYPQGAERMLIARALGRKLEPGQRPYDVGTIVLNVSTARAIGDAFTRGMPLIERAVTVSGEKVRNKGNYMVRIGTSALKLLDYCGVEDDAEIRLGGVMMGSLLDNFDVPVIKGTNAVIATSRSITWSSDCIKCGRCVNVCPMELLPLYYPHYEATDNFSAMAQMNVNHCIECACCDYICPSGIDITGAVRKGKKNLC